MTAANFKKSLDRVLVYEGGYSNHPRDPGGPTNKGIIQRVYDGYRKGKGEEPRSVKLITQQEVQDIYRRQYWNMVQGDRLPPGLDLVVFDGGVNSGVYQSGKWLQRALGDLYKGPVDGHIGESTLAAVEAHPDHDQLIAGVLARRLGMLKSLKTWSDFGKGWGARVASVKDIGQAWASGSVGPQPVAVHEIGGDAKAYASDVALPPVSQETGTQTTVGGLGLAGLVQGAVQTVQPVADQAPLLTYAFVGLTILSVAIAVSGAIYALYASRKSKQAQRAIDGDVVAEFDDPPQAVPA